MQIRSVHANMQPNNSSTSVSIFIPMFKLAAGGTSERTVMNESVILIVTAVTLSFLTKGFVEHNSMNDTENIQPR